MAITLHSDSAAHGRAVRPGASALRSAAVLALAVGLTVAVLACLGSVIGRWS